MANVDTLVANVDTLVANVDTLVANVDTLVANVDTLVANVDTLVANVDTHVDNLAPQPRPRAGKGVSLMIQALIDEKEAAAYLGLSVKTLQARRFRRELPKHIKMGRSVRYRLEDLDAFVAAHIVDPSRAA